MNNLILKKKLFDFMMGNIDAVSDLDMKIYPDLVHFSNFSLKVLKSIFTKLLFFS